MIATVERTGTEAGGQGAGELASCSCACGRRAVLLTRLESVVSARDDVFLESLVSALERAGDDGEGIAVPPANAGEPDAASPASDEASPDMEAGVLPAELLSIVVSTADIGEQLADLALAVTLEDVPAFLRDLRAVAGRYARRYADALNGDVQDAVREAV